MQIVLEHIIVDGVVPFGRLGELLSPKVEYQLLLGTPRLSEVIHFLPKKFGEDIDPTLWLGKISEEAGLAEPTINLHRGSTRLGEIPVVVARTFLG